MKPVDVCAEAKTIGKTNVIWCTAIAFCYIWVAGSIKGLSDPVGVEALSLESRRENEYRGKSERESVSGKRRHDGDEQQAVRLGSP